MTFKINLLTGIVTPNRPLKSWEEKLKQSWEEEAKRMYTSRYSTLSLQLRNKVLNSKVNR